MGLLCSIMKVLGKYQVYLLSLSQKTLQREAVEDLLPFHYFYPPNVDLCSLRLLTRVLVPFPLPQCCWPTDNRPLFTDPKIPLVIGQGFLQTYFSWLYIFREKLHLSDPLNKIDDDYVRLEYSGKLLFFDYRNMVTFSSCSNQSVTIVEKNFIPYKLLKRL